MTVDLAISWVHVCGATNTCKSEFAFPSEITRAPLGFFLIEVDVIRYVVHRLLPGGPADRSGLLQAGDVIDSVDGRRTQGASLVLLVPHPDAATAE